VGVGSHLQKKKRVGRGREGTRHPTTTMRKPYFANKNRRIVAKWRPCAEIYGNSFFMNEGEQGQGKKNPSQTSRFWTGGGRSSIKGEIV